MNDRVNIISDPLIVGCWQLDNRSWKFIEEADIERAIDTYIALGISTFDTADIYGRSEEVLGKILKKTSATILTKAVFFDEIPTVNQIRHKIENSLRNLQRDTLDCVQIHWHDPNLDFAYTFDIFRQFLDQGKIRQIGVTNFNTPMLEKALKYLPIKTNQIQYSLIDRRLENSLQVFCVQNQIKLLCYGPLAGGFLSDKFRGMVFPPKEIDHARGFYYINMIIKHGGWNSVQQILEILARIAAKYNLDVSQLALNWVKNQIGVKSVICGFTQDRMQIKNNLEALNQQIDPEDLQILSESSYFLFQQRGDVYSYERG